MAPAVESPGIHLGVWHDRGELHVWGTTRTIPKYCFVLEASSPGLLVIKHHSGEVPGKFVNVAVLEGDQIKIVEEHSSFARFSSPNASSHSVNILVQLAVSMRSHGRGGCLLIVPAESESWRESIVQPMTYAVSPPFSELARLSKAAPTGTRRIDVEDEIGRTIDWIAGLTAVDGAALINDRYDLLGFGAKITRRNGNARAEQVILTEPIQRAVPALVHPLELGGTRHLSAVQFVHDQRDAIALVASQDGRFTIFEWSSSESMVHAHRVETLLM